jgi:hypothetical protein
MLISYKGIIGQHCKPSPCNALKSRFSYIIPYR